MSSDDSSSDDSAGSSDDSAGSGDDSSGSGDDSSGSDGDTSSDSGSVFASDDGDYGGSAGEEDAQFNDIDGLLPDDSEVGEVGTYVRLDGAESDDNRRCSYL